MTTIEGLVWLKKQHGTVFETSLFGGKEEGISLREMIS